MTTPLFTGVGVALVTLFDDDGEVDLDATAALAAELVAAGITRRRPRRVDRRGGDVRRRRTRRTRQGRAGGDPGRPSRSSSAPVPPRPARPPASPPRSPPAGPTACSCCHRRGAPTPSAYYEQVVAAADGALPVLGVPLPADVGAGHRRRPPPRLTDVGVVGLKDSSGDASRLVRTLEAFEGALTSDRRGCCRRPDRSARPVPSSPWPTSSPAWPSPRSAATSPPSARSRRVQQRAAGPAGVKAVLAERTGRSRRTRVG